MGRGRRIKTPFEVPAGKVYLVGGALRDELLGEATKDHDWALGGVENLDDLFPEAEPLEVAGQRIGWRLPSGEEVALLRRERSLGPGHTDFAIDCKNVTIEEDLRRRDFTCNAIAMDMSNGEIIDPFGGAEDIKNGDLRAISEDAFREDPLRVLRGARLQSERGLRPTEETLLWMQAGDVQALSPERVLEEMRRILRGKHAGEALRTLRETGQYAALFPELEPTLGWDQQSRYHSLSCDEHCIQTLESSEGDEALRWAAWLHDCGKPASAWTGRDGRLHYYANPEAGKKDHAEEGELIARELMRRLRAPRALEEDVAYLVRHHMWGETRQNWDSFSEEKRDRRARRFVLQHGRYAENLLRLRRADTLAKGKDSSDELRRLRDFWERVMRAEEGSWRNLAINGHDLQEIGLQGPQIGRALSELQQRVCDNPHLNERERLLRWAKKLL